MMKNLRNDNIPLLAAAVSLAVIIADVLLAARSHLLTPLTVAMMAVIPLIVSLLVYMRRRLALLENQETIDQRIAGVEAPQATLFGQSDDDDESFTARRSRRLFERWIVSAASAVLLLVELFLAWQCFKLLRQFPESDGEYLFSASMFAGQGFVLFILSRFLLGLSRSGDRRLLRGSGIYLGMLALASVLAVASALLAHAEIMKADRIFVWCMLGLFVVLALENLVSTLGRIYRPRRSRGAENVAYESRLGSLLTDPAAWVNDFAQALDYQFGFDVSNTWFYRFLGSALAPLLLFQLLALYLLSCLVILEPEEQAIRERFGVPIEQVDGGLLDSGLHFKFPWPFETVRRFPVKRIQTKHIGFKEAVVEAPEVMLWTVAHHAEKETFLTASRAQKSGDRNDDVSVPVNMLSVHVPIEYYIDDIYAYAYNYVDPDRMLETIAYRNITFALANQEVNSLLSSGQLALTGELRENIQKEIDGYNLGIRVQFVGLQGIHPPTTIAGAFEQVVGSIEEKESLILEAKAHTEQVLPVAAANAAVLKMQAASYTVRRKAMAGAEAYQFEQRLQGYLRSPDVFRNEIYLRTLEAALVDCRKYVVSVENNRSQVLQFDFQEKIKPDDFDFGTEQLMKEPSK